MISKQALTDELARESGNTLLILTAHMALCELFAPLPAEQRQYFTASMVDRLSTGICGITLHIKRKNCQPF